MGSSGAAIMDKGNYFNPVIEALAEPVFVFGPNGDFHFCNQAARDILKILGYSSGKKPEQHDTFLQVLQFSGQQDDAGGIAFNGLRYNISSRSFEDGILLRLLPRLDDEHMLRLSSSIDVMPWGLVTVDFSSPDPVCVFSNPKAGKFLKMPHRDIIGLPVMEALSKFGLDQDIAPNLRGKEITYYDHETKGDGPICWYRLHFIPYSRGNPYCLIVIEDTTDHKIREGQYFQAQRLEALGQLAGGVAHDFNNILSIIDGYARIGKKAVAGNEETVGYFERIMQSVQRGAALTNRLLTFGRHKVVKDGVVDLGQLVQDQESLLRPLLDASIALTIVAEENVFISAPPDNICQILLNLCINSRDAMPDGGTLSIECAKAKNARAVLRVTDTGQGIPPAIKAKIFDPFFTTKDQGKGTGLGLSMVYGLVKDMKGEIDVSSKIGEGTSFTITLPLSESRPPLHEVTEDENGNIRLDGFTALIAEDEPALLDLVSGMVEEIGIKVLRATNGNEALMIQDEYDGDIDFLLTDVVMPELNGVKLAELFESVRPESRVMFMSGYPASGQMARVSLPDSAFFMPKPVEFNKLCEVLKTMTDEPNSTLKERWKVLSGQWKSQ